MRMLYILLRKRLQNVVGPDTEEHVEVSICRGRPAGVSQVIPQQAPSAHLQPTQTTGAMPHLNIVSPPPIQESSASPPIHTSPHPVDQHPHAHRHLPTHATQAPVSATNGTGGESRAAAGVLEHRLGGAAMSSPAGTRAHAAVGGSGGPVGGGGAGRGEGEEAGELQAIMHELRQLKAFVYSDHSSAVKFDRSTAFIKSGQTEAAQLLRAVFSKMSDIKGREADLEHLLRAAKESLDKRKAQIQRMGKALQQQQQQQQGSEEAAVGGGGGLSAVEVVASFRGVPCFEGWTLRFGD
jgi:hypothetical protein